jgi:hypothetical protein
VHEPKLGTLALISAQEKIDRIGKQKKCKSRRRRTTTTLFLVIPYSAKFKEELSRNRYLYSYLQLGSFFFKSF